MLQQKHTVPGHRRAAALQWALSAAVVLAVSAVLIAACGRSDASDPPDDASSTTEPERETTVLGCEVYPLDDLVEGTGSVTEGVTAVVPYCTDVKLIERECGIDSDSLRVPPVEEPIPGASTRVYLDAAGSPTASFLTYTGSGGPPGAVSTLVCPDGHTTDFSPQDIDDFNSPAGPADHHDPPGQSSVPADIDQVLPPAVVPAASAVCEEPLTPTANGNPSPLMCDDGAINVQAWESLASSNPSLLALGSDVTVEDVQQAICSDRIGSTNQMASSAYELAAAYYGWAFPGDPTAFLYEADDPCGD